MRKYITRDKLADFLEKMWDAGLRVDLNPEKRYLSIYDANFHAEYVDVVDAMRYEETVAECLEMAKAAEKSSDEL